LWVLGGVRLFAGCLSLFARCLLSFPSTTYWSGFYLRILLRSDLINGFSFKLLAVAVLAGFFLWLEVPLRLRTVAYLCSFALLGILLAVLRTSRIQYGMPLEPDLTALKVGEYLAVPTKPSAQEIRFFEGSRLMKIAYYDNRNRSVYLLSVEVAGDVHKLHPTELCLKSGKAVIHGLHEKILTAAGMDLALQELVATQPDGRSYLIYTWYVGPEWSTGSFIAFRKNWNRKSRWQSFQLLTEITDTKTAAEQRLNSFLRLLPAAPLPR